VNKSKVAIILTIALNMCMLTVATLFQNIHLIVPVAAAITFGCWVNREERWIHKPWQIVIVPTLSAALGVGLNQIAMAPLYRYWIALFSVIFLFLIFNSAIGPSIAVALLPIVLNVHTWLFVLSVFVMTFIVMIGVMYRDKRPTAEKVPRKARIVPNIVFIVIGMIWIGVSYALDVKFAIIPPLMVVLYESMSKRVNKVNRVMRQTGLLAAASLIGASAVAIWPDLIIIPGGVALFGSVMLMSLFDTWLPPTMAISLLPLVFPIPPFQFPLYILTLSVIVSVITLTFSKYMEKSIRFNGKEG